ncbi:unnamed protein product [Peniophora sp. CBMAI 1063]|nr:unnamed protein product [Peniophora sp. CBMAI 1063]
MPVIDATNYLADLPQAGIHIDADNEEDYCLPRTLDSDLLIWKETHPDTRMVTWWMHTNVRVAPVPLSADARTNTISVANDWQICDLQHLIIVQPAPGPQRSHIRVHAPRTFSGVSNDKGVCNPTPCDFIWNVRNYLVTGEEAAGNPLSNHVKIVLVSMLLNQSAAMWYEQIMADYAEYWQMADQVQHTFLAMFLQQFEDVDIQKTVITKIQSMQQGAQSVEVHTRLFKDWAGHTGFNNTTLIELYRRSLKPAICNKVNCQGKHRPDTLQGWYKDTMLFDRQWREDHPDRPLSPPLGAGPDGSACISS